ncbi:MAG: hypothetical protein M0R17_03320 [Candidatus Omnitrophica bacterium]|jgi:hypothetical protein|nr:hypothetical protein [Candidatus Omnitrophota bacterium]
MNKDIITSHPGISLNDKTILRGILDRHNSDEFCPICTEIIESLLLKELDMNQEQYKEIQESIQSLKIDVNELDHRCYN